VTPAYGADSVICVSESTEATLYITPVLAMVNESPAVTFASHRVLVPVTVGLLLVVLANPVEY
jgi:hypothetical protein